MFDIRHAGVSRIAQLRQSGYSLGSADNDTKPARGGNIPDLEEYYRKNGGEFAGRPHQCGFSASAQKLLYFGDVIRRFRPFKMAQITREQVWDPYGFLSRTIMR